MPAGRFVTPKAVNEKVRDYTPGSEDRRQLKLELERQAGNPVDIPLVIGGEPVQTGKMGRIACPHDHGLNLGVYHLGTPETVAKAISAASAAKPSWQRLPWEDRAAVFLKAADLLASRYRHTMNAATMLGQSKTAYQAEIDAGCELTDYLRFNVMYVCRIYSSQPDASPQGNWNKLEYRPLDGHVLAVAPFNFTSISGNLPTAPAMMGNTVIWKPASSAVLSAHYFMKILLEAGLPEGVINMVPGAGSDIANPVLDHRDLAGLHFTGSTGTFIYIWGRVAANLGRRVYRSYPRLVGETGGKDFILACPDAGVDELAVAMVRGSFEYQGQKCSASSRAYIPASIWPRVRARVAEMTEQAKVGDVRDFRSFMGAVIDRTAFERITKYIEECRASSECEIVAGGRSDDSKGFFIRPTVVRTDDPRSRGMSEEIFGPVLTVYVYPDRAFDETLNLIDSTSPYALTGSIFGRDRALIRTALDRLSQAAGNIYINDKPTGAVVGQQPFGGGRMSGTNDKAGGYFNMLRWTSPQAVKENFIPPREPFYRHMSEE